MSRNQVEAVAYFRIPAATSARDDALQLQRKAVTALAKAKRMTIVGEFYDIDGRDADMLEHRPGFAKMLAMIEYNGVQAVIVEDADRLAHSQQQRELGAIVMKSRGVRLYTAAGKELTDANDRARKLLQDVALAYGHFEKARMVYKLGAIGVRARVRRVGEGRKPVPAGTVAEAKSLARKVGLSLRAIARELAKRGHTVMIDVDGKRVPSGRPYGAESIKRMITN